jgi:hypothetical protein
MWSSVVVEQSAVSLGATAQSLDCTVKHRQRYPVKMRRVTFVVLSTSRVARASVQGRALDDVVVCSCRGETTQSLVRQRSASTARSNVDSVICEKASSIFPRTIDVFRRGVLAARASAGSGFVVRCRPAECRFVWERPHRDFRQTMDAFR